MTYSNATDVLGILLERIEGKSLQDVLTERVLGPLNMADTGFFVGAAQPRSHRHHVQARGRRHAQP